MEDKLQHWEAVAEQMREKLAATLQGVRIYYNDQLNDQSDLTLLWRHRFECMQALVHRIFQQNRWDIPAPLPEPPTLALPLRLGEGTSTPTPTPALPSEEDTEKMERQVQHMKRP